MLQQDKRTHSESAKACPGARASASTIRSKMLGLIGALSKQKGALWCMALFLTMFSWWQLPHAIASMLFPFAWVVTAQLVFAGAFEAARLRRRAWLGQYLKTSSPWSRWLRGGVVMVVWHQLVSAILATVLLVSLRLTGLLDLVFLVASAILFLILGRWARARLARHVIPDYLAAVTRRLLVVPVSMFLVAGLIAVSLLRPQPYLVGMDLERAVQSNIVSNGQSLLGVLERVASTLEVTSFWAVQNALDSLGVAGWIAILGWVGVFALQGALALAFVRFLVGAVAAYEALRNVKERTTAGGASLPAEQDKGE